MTSYVVSTEEFEARVNDGRIRTIRTIAQRRRFKKYPELANNYITQRDYVSKMVSIAAAIEKDGLECLEPGAWVSSTAMLVASLFRLGRVIYIYSVTLGNYRPSTSPVFITSVVPLSRLSQYFKSRISI